MMIMWREKGWIEVYVSKMRPRKDECKIKKSEKKMKGGKKGGSRGEVQSFMKIGITEKWIKIRGCG